MTLFRTKSEQPNFDALQNSFFKMLFMAERCLPEIDWDAKQNARIQKGRNDLIHCGMAFATIMDESNSSGNKVSESTLAQLQFYYDQVKRYVYQCLNNANVYKVIPVYSDDFEGDFRRIDRDFNKACNTLKLHAVSNRYGKDNANSEAI